MSARHCCGCCMASLPPSAGQSDVSAAETATAVFELQALMSLCCGFLQTACEVKVIRTSTATPTAGGGCACATAGATWRAGVCHAYVFARPCCNQDTATSAGKGFNTGDLLGMALSQHSSGSAGFHVRHNRQACCSTQLNSQLASKRCHKANSLLDRTTAVKFLCQCPTAAGCSLLQPQPEGPHGRMQLLRGVIGF